MTRSTGWVVLAAIAITGCGSEKKDAATKAQQGEPPAVVVAPVVQKTVPIFTELTARTDANDSVDIRARVKAFLQTQNFQEGTIVDKGQLLFTLDKREYAAQLQQAKAQLAKAEADLAKARDNALVDTARANVQIAEAQLGKANLDVSRLKPLAEQQAVPQQDYDNALARQTAAIADLEGKKSSLATSSVQQKADILQAQAATEAAKASISQAELNLEFCNITSPIHGLIGTRQIAPGNLVGGSEATLLATVSNVNPMRVFAAISERDYLIYQRLRKSGKSTGAGEIQLMLADGTVYPHPGKVIIADRAVDLKTGTLSIVTEFPNPENLLRPGQFGRVRLAASTVENALLVPQKAITELQSAKILYIVGPENKIQLRNVVLGERSGQDYIITEGVKAGERVVVEGILKVRPGMVVKPVDQPLTTEKTDEKKGR